MLRSAIFAQDRADVHVFSLIKHSKILEKFQEMKFYRLFRCLFTVNTCSHRILTKLSVNVR